MLDPTTRLTAGTANLKLQAALKVGTCDAAGTGEVYADVSSSGGFNFYGSSGLSDGDWTYSGGVDPSDGNTIYRQNYTTANNFTNRTFMSPSGQSGLWDFSLTPNADAYGGTYCLRVVKSDNSTLETYSQIPEITVPAGQFQKLRHGQYFDTSGTRQPLYW